LSRLIPVKCFEWTSKNFINPHRKYFFMLPIKNVIILPTASVADVLFLAAIIAIISICYIVIYEKKKI